MAEYVIAPWEEPDWRFDPQDFADRLRQRWPDARVGLGSTVGSTMALEALIPFAEPQRELGIALSGTGQAVTLEPADPDTAAEFAFWYLRQVPDPTTELSLFEPGTMFTIGLNPGLTEESIERQLSAR